MSFGKGVVTGVLAPWFSLAPRLHPFPKTYIYPTVSADPKRSVHTENPNGLMVCPFATEKEMLGSFFLFGMITFLGAVKLQGCSLSLVYKLFSISGSNHSNHS